MNNNPLRYTDPSGHCIFGLDTVVCITVGAMVVGAIGGYVAQVANNMSTGMSFGDALVTDISGTTILQGAVIGGLGAATLIAGGGAVVTLGTIMLADGDPTNDIQMVNTTLQQMRLETNRITGQLGEQAAGIVKNTKHISSLTNTATYRIPDALDPLGPTLVEVKNVGTLQLTNQIRDFALWSQLQDVPYTFEIIVRKSVSITSSMAQFIDKHGIVIKHLIE
ncbi:MAG TPA: hypothetical protein DD636_03490 [Anaerolineaceae bacterium]|nr:hypothetical protein [Anaerolineaceae bacterium]